jgi:glutamate formiminotransferase
VAVGARPILVAFNVLLAATLQQAQAIARQVRASSGGLLGVQALGFATSTPGIVQVSMNLTDLEATPVINAVQRVAELAETEGVVVIESELVGLIPQREVERAARRPLDCEDPSRVLEAGARTLRLPRIEPRQVIELALTWK